MLLLDQVVHIDADNADVITMLMKRKPSEVAHNVESTYIYSGGNANADAVTIKAT